MSYTEEQIELIRESWGEMKQMGMQELGLLIFHRLLNETPFLRRLFYEIEIDEEEELPLEQMRQRRKVKSHATRIAMNITRYVDALHDPEEMESVLDELGAIHTQKRVDPEYFEYLMPVLLWVISNRLGLTSASPTMQAWIVCYSRLRRGIVSHMRV